MSLSKPASVTALCLPLLAFALLVLAGKFLLIAHYGSLTPMHDEWDGTGYRLYRLYVDGKLGWADMLAPFNEHRIFLTRVLQLALLRLDGGIWNPVLQMAVNACLHVAALTGLVWGLAKACPERLGSGFLLLALLVFGVPLAVENVLVGFQSQFYFLMLGNFACLWAVATAPVFSAKWWGGFVAGALGTLAMASGSLALLVAALFVTLRKLRAGSRPYELAGALVLLLPALLMVALTPAVHTFDAYRAHSPLDFLIAALRVFSWPLLPGAFLLLYWPLLQFLITQLRRPPAAYDPSWFLFAMGLWQLGQMLAICYSRAALPITSRYVDLFCIGLVLNGACLLRQWQSGGEGEGSALTPLRQLWVVAALGGLIWYGSHIPPFLAQKLAFSPPQEVNVRAYLQSHDYSILLNNEYPLIPYAEPPFLKQMLDDPALVSVLPSNLVPAHQAQESGLVLALLAHLQAIALLLAAAGLGLAGVSVAKEIRAR